MDLFSLIDLLITLLASVPALRNALGIRKRLPWGVVRGAIERLADRVEQSYDPQYVLAVSVKGVAGGAIVGDMLAQCLGVPLVVVMLEENIDGTRSFLEMAREIEAGSRVLLVDDIAFTGSTLREAVKHIRRQVEGVEVRCAVLVAFDYVFRGRTVRRDRPYTPDYHIFTTREVRYKMPWGGMKPSK